MGIFTFEGPGPILFIFYPMILGGNTKYQPKKDEKMKEKCCAYTDTQEGERDTNIRVIHKVTQLGDKNSQFQHNRASNT